VRVTFCPYRSVTLTKSYEIIRALGYKGMPTRRFITIGLGSIAVVIIVVYVITQRRSREVYQLYAEAAGIAPYFRGTEGARSAIGHLRSFKTDEATSALLELASGKTPFVWPSVQEAAIDALSERADQRIPTRSRTTSTMASVSIFRMPSSHPGQSRHTQLRSNKGSGFLPTTGTNAICR